MLKTSAIWLNRCLWAVIVTALVVVAVYVSIGRYYVGYIEKYQDVLLEQLAEYTGLPITAGRLHGRWSRLSPLLTLEQVRLSAPGSEETVLGIDTMQVQIAPFRSLLERTISIDKLYINGVRCSLSEAEPGRWRLRGYPVTGQGMFGDVDTLADLALSVNNVELSDAFLELNFHNDRNAAIGLRELSLRRDEDFRRIRLIAMLDDQDQPVRGTFEANGDPREYENFTARGYLKLEDVDFSEYLPVIRPLGVELQQAVVDSELWLDWHPGTEIVAQGYINTPNVDLAGLSGESLQPLREVALRFRAEKNRRSDWQVWVPTLQAQWHGEPLSFEHMAASFTDNRFSWAIPALSVDQLKQHLLDVNLLAGPEQTLLETLSPSGQLHNLHVSYFFPESNKVAENDERPRFAVRANLQGGSIQAWHGAPGATGVNGYIEARPLSGMLELDSNDLALDFPVVYRHSLHFDSALAQLRWQIDPHSVKVHSGPILLHGEHGPASGLLALDLPLEKDEGTPLMDLVIGIRDTDAKYRDLFLPYTLDEHFLQWMQGSVPAGEVVEGGFIYRGSLLKDDAPNRTVQLFFDVKDVTLDYHPDWPALTGIRGLVLIDDGSVRVESEQAKVYSMDVPAALVTVEPIDDGMWLSVDARASGNAFDALQVVNNSMIDRLVEGAFQQWRLSGQAETAIQLGVPLAGSGREPDINVTVQLADGQLEIPQVRTLLTGVDGTLYYHSGSGFSSKNLTARLYDKSLNVSVRQDESQGLSVDISGRLAMEDVAEWSGQPAMAFVSGATDFDARVYIAPKTPETSAAEAMVNAESGERARPGSEFTVNSQLRGVTIDLPEPYAKQADTPLAFQLRQPLDRESSLLQMNLEHRAELQLLLEGRDVKSGLLILGEGAVAEHYPGLFTVTGSVPVFNLEQWQPVLERYRNQQDATKENGAVHDGLKVVASRLLIESFDGFSQHFEDCTIDLSQRDDGWWLSMINPMFDGEMFLPTETSQPISLRLDRLQLPAANPIAPADEDAGMLKGINPRELDNFTAYVAIADLWRGEAHYGSLSFKLQTEPGRVQLQNLGGAIRDIRIGVDSPAHLEWRATEQGMQSRVSGDIDFGNISDVLSHWNYERIIESEYGTGSLDLSWPGRPDQWQLARSKGSLSLRLDDGRFLKASEAATGTLKVVGIVNLMNVVRRLRLDFSDVYKKGISYDRVEGSARVADGQLILTDDLVVDSPSSRFHLRGNADLLAKQLDMELIATLPVASNLPWVAALAGGLPTAAGVYVASKIFEKEMDRLSSAVYSVKGDWNEPELNFKRVFDTSSDKKPAAEPASPEKPESAISPKPATSTERAQP